MTERLFENAPRRVFRYRPAPPPGHPSGYHVGGREGERAGTACETRSFARFQTDSERHPIILFDAQCVLCSANAQFVLRHDRARRFRLAAMQGHVGAALFRRFGIDPADPDTIIVVDGDRALRDSDAVIAIYTGLGWPWRAAAMLRLVPRRLRDRGYRWIARRRYRLFGRRAICWRSRPEDADRVL